MTKLLSFIFIFPLCINAQVTTVLNEWKIDKDLANASYGFCISDAKTGSVISEYNSHLALIPASTLKVLTTYAALSVLGQHFRFETKIYHTGTFDQNTGVIDGDIIIMGSGDPTIQSEHFSKDNLSVTDKWAKQLKEKGVKEVKGRIIGDGSYLDRTVPDNWIWSDISNYYGSVPCGLSYMDNKFKISFSTKETGTQANLIAYTPAYMTKSVTLHSFVIAKGTEDKAFVYGDPFSFEKDIRGSLPVNKKQFDIEAALPDPALLCAEMFYKSLINIGIRCSTQQTPAISNYVFSETGETKQLLFSHFSPYLDNILTSTNLKSINLFSESLLRAMGKGEMQKGIEQVKNYWQTRGMFIDELNLLDGSGLSRSNTITTSLMSAILCKIYGDTENYKIFLASLPVAGKSGSMTNIGKGKFIENNLHAKTGYMERVRAYAGYLKTKTGKDIAFSVIINNYNCSAKEMKIKIEKYLVALEGM